jgi:hypothetical protein
MSHTSTSYPEAASRRAIAPAKPGSIPQMIIAAISVF